MKYNTKKKLQIAIRRYYSSDSKQNNMLELTGINKNGYREHINKFLLEGMSKENFGSEWGLDHIVPVHLFNLDDEDELKLCYNHNNIMPMFNLDNRAKGASVHFSLTKLESMYTNVYIEKLKEKCNNEIKNIYEKYLI